MSDTRCGYGYSVAAQVCEVLPCPSLLASPVSFMFSVLSIVFSVLSQFSVLIHVYSANRGQSKHLANKLEKSTVSECPLVLLSQVSNQHSETGRMGGGKDRRTEGNGFFASFKYSDGQRPIHLGGRYGELSPNQSASSRLLVSMVIKHLWSHLLDNGDWRPRLRPFPASWLMNIHDTVVQ